MTLSRCLLIAALPFMVAVFMSWLSSVGLSNTVFVVLAWLTFLNVLLAGISIAAHLFDFAKNARRIAKLKACGALLMALLALLASLLWFMHQPFASLGLAALLLMLTLKNLKSSSLWALLTAVEALLIARYSWIAVGSTLMVGLAYWRHLHIVLV